MTAISINIPDRLANASAEAAKELGIPRAEFIRRAIRHEIRNYQKHMEQEVMGETLCAMEEHTEYRIISKEIDDNLDSPLPDDEEKWWSR